MNKDDLTYLLLGLEGWLEPNQTALPQELRYSMNRLSLHLGKDYPTTFTGLLELLHQPLRTWWRGELTGFSMDAPLLEDGTLSFEAHSYLGEILGGRPQD